MVRLLLVLVSLLALTACGGDPVSYEPTGVDQLEIPTPSPDPGDFVDGVDNPWLPLTPGSTWTYDDGSSTGLSVRVTDETRTVAGVAVTVVETSVADLTTTRLYAQDDRGNVWLFGESARGTTWEAGVDGAQAGLAMPAEPRVGDGYRPARADGVAEDVVTVVSLDAFVDVAFGTFDAVLQTEVTSPLEADRVVRASYARGVGLVLEEQAGSDERVELVEFTRG